MSSEFVRYTPEIETIDPHIDEPLAQIIDFAEKRAVNRRRQRASDGPSAPRTRSHSAWSRQKSRYWPTCRRRMRRGSTPTRRPRRLDSPLQHLRSPRHGRATRGESHLHHN